MQPSIKKGGFEVVFHKKYPFGTKDFSALITGAKSAGAEILYAYPIPPEAPTILKQMKELDFNPKVTFFFLGPLSVLNYSKRLAKPAIML